MRLLVVTQKVDQNDDVLGFFHEWLKRLAEKCDTLEVICLYEGAHTLPANVRVHSLGKERGSSRLKYLRNLFYFVFSLRYDSVFVHMNEEYVLLCSWWWRLMGKRVVLWRNHKMGSWRTRLAARLANAICYTSPSAFIAQYKKAVLMPIGIDTDFFSPPAIPAPANSILFLGRLDPVKKVEVFIEALEKVNQTFRADLYGSPTEPNSAYAKQIATKAQPLIEAGKLALYPGVPFIQTPEIYRSHAVYVNLTPSGSFDKTIGEAMASGCVVVCANEALRGVLPDQFIVSGIEVAGTTLTRVLALSEQEYQAFSDANRRHIEQDHSLRLLAQRLAAILQA